MFGIYKVLLFISIIVCIGVFVLLFNMIDHIPAKYSDFEELIEIAKSVPDNPFVIFENYGEITVDSNGMKYALANEECSIKATYDEHFHLLEIKQNDNSSPLWFVLLESVFYGLLIGYGFFRFLCFIVDRLSSFKRE